MEDCCEEAHEAQQLLRNGTFDLPRMSKVLENQKVFLLVDEGTVRRYKADLADEIEPQINELIERAEKGLKILSRKQALIQSKVEAAQAMQSRAATAPTANKREERRVQMLSKQRQRLGEEVRVLESEILALVCFVCKKRLLTLTPRDSITKSRCAHDCRDPSVPLTVGAFLVFPRDPQINVVR
ncbi:hypothetical protein J3R83DRAFT_9604 [Lanmaoa asiatica]|nr:hypothetical protein J3R83DRAFT_9604 [Lanmaoa asiatica]